MEDADVASATNALPMALWFGKHRVALWRCGQNPQVTSVGLSHSHPPVNKLIIISFFDDRQARAS